MNNILYSTGGGAYVCKPALVCSGTYIDPLTSNSHCGACGVVCSGIATCQNGTCVASGNGTCAAPYIVPPGTAFSHSGTTVGGTNHRTGSCTSVFNATALDRVYIIQPSASVRSITASTCTGTSFDTILHATASTCGSGTEVACNDDACSLQSSITWSAAANTTYYLYVDGYNGASGSYTVTITGL